MTKKTKSRGGSTISIGSIQDTQNVIIGDHSQMTVYGSRDRKLEAKIDALAERLDANQQQILQKLDVQQLGLVEKVYSIVDMQAVGIDEHSQGLEAINRSLDNLAQRDNLPPAVAQQIEQIYATVLPPVETAGVDIRHRLKATIPIIPFFLAYEGELEVNARQEWDQVKALVQKF